MLLREPQNVNGPWMRRTGGRRPEGSEAGACQPSSDYPRSLPAASGAHLRRNGAPGAAAGVHVSAQLRRQPRSKGLRKSPSGPCMYLYLRHGMGGGGGEGGRGGGGGGWWWEGFC